MLDLVARVKRVIEFFAIDGDFIAQTAGQKRIAEFAEIFASRSGSVAAAVHCRVSRSIGPGNGVAKLGGVGEDRRLHDLEVLLILGSSARGHLIQPLPGMGFVDTAEATEGSKELIVTAYASAGNKAAHRERVDEVIVEALVLEGVGGTNIAFAANWLRRNAPRGA